MLYIIITHLETFLLYGLSTERGFFYCDMEPRLMPFQLVALDDKQGVLIKYSNSDPLGYHQVKCILNPWLLYT